ncbi:MAG: stage II sporulation protein M [Clostridia bacterium]
MRSYIQKYIDENKLKIYSILICLIIGLVVGFFTYKFTSASIREELNKTIKTTLELTKQEGFQGINIIKNGIASNILICFIMYLSCITIVAPGIVCIINSLKGFSIGIYIPTIFYVFGFWNGIICFFILVILPNLVYIPSFIYLSVNAINFHNVLVDKFNEKSKLKVVTKESIYLIVTISIMSFAIVIEQLASIGVINIYREL